MINTGKQILLAAALVSALALLGRRKAERRFRRAKTLFDERLRRCAPPLLFS